MAERPFDVVLFGATGFVGALTAEHLAAAGGPGTRVALAGRSPERLAEVRSRLGEPGRDWALVEVDATDAVGLRRLAARTTVLATTVGPYARDGRHVVTACAEEGTHYADLTGELLFVRWALETVDARARETGARIVHSCGFDSIPSDLGVLLTADRASADGEGTLADTTLVVRSMRGASRVEPSTPPASRRSRCRPTPACGASCATRTHSARGRRMNPLHGPRHARDASAGCAGGPGPSATPRRGTGWAAS